MGTNNTYIQVSRGNKIAGLSQEGGHGGFSPALLRSALVPIYLVTPTPHMGHRRSLAAITV